MRRLLVLSFVLAVAACTPKPPPGPVPTPTPPPPPVAEFPEMLLRTCGTGQFCLGGQPIDFAGCESCCMEWEGGHSGWPLIFKPFVDWSRGQGRCNFWHARPGPFNVADEPEWADIGGPYVEDANGKADLTQWNEKFWTAYKDVARHVCSVGGHLEEDKIDTWRLKGSCVPSPWNASRNIQGEDHCNLVPGDPVQDAFLKKQAETTGLLGCVIYQIGNESAQVMGKNAQLKLWEQWVRDRIRFWEQEVGGGLVHMIGTNSEFDEIEAASWIDYVNRHSETPRAPMFGKPTANNEMNPDPDPDTYLSLYCAARLGGAYQWAWRAGASKDAWDSILSKISAARLNNCQGVNTDPCPWHVPETVYIHCKPFSPWDDGIRYDCTPQRLHQPGGAPTWPEDEYRAACEAKSMGCGEDYCPSMWITDATGSLTFQQHPGNSLQFILRGSGSAMLHCSAPASGSDDLCGYAVSR